MKTAIIGHGWVGQAMEKMFPSSIIYDHHNPNREEVNKCDIAFICVPTPNLPMNKDEGTGVYQRTHQYSESKGKLDISIVEESVAWCECPIIVLRSTVNPGTTDYLIKKYKKHIIMQPEYLGETPAHPMLDTKQRQFLIIGGDKKDVRKLIELYQEVYNANITIRQTTAYEAELIKLTENRAIAFKVAECQELYDACEKTGVDYYIIRDAVYGDDPRFNLWFTFVYPNKRGFNSKCIPKDVYAWAAWAESAGYQPTLTRSLLEANDRLISSNTK